MLRIDLYSNIRKTPSQATYDANSMAGRGGKDPLALLFAGVVVRIVWRKEGALGDGDVMPAASFLAVVFAVQHIAAVTSALIGSDDVATDVLAASVVLRALIPVGVEDGAEPLALHRSVRVELNAQRIRVRSYGLWDFVAAKCPDLFRGIARAADDVHEIILAFFL